MQKEIIICKQTERLRTQEERKELFTIQIDLTRKKRMRKKCQSHEKKVLLVREKTKQ